MDIQIHFLRPWWFLGLVPVIWLLWQAWFIKSRQGAWQSVIDPQFQPLLLGERSENSGLHSARLAVVGLAAIWVMAIIALAGPSLKSVKIPAQKTHQGSVIVLDLSLSMLAQDVQPNRISRVRFKLTDLLNSHPERAFGMVGYAGSAHTIAPVSEDNRTLLGLLPTLNPLIMPKYGSDPLMALKLAENLLQGANIRDGHLIWVTDDLEPGQRKAIQDWFKNRGLSLSILAVGTENGGTVPIPDYGLLKDDGGAIVTPKLPYSELEALSRQTGAALTPLTIDDHDIERLLPSELGRIAQQNANRKDGQEEKSVLHRLDDGTAVLLAMLIPFALAYRRGWMFGFALLVTLPLGGLYAPPANAEWKFSDLTEVFQTPDQQAYKAWKKEDYQAAESLFESPQWKGATLYRNGKYKEAAQQFQKDRSARGRYNLGNALARQGKLQQARQAYEQALQKDPQMTDARANLDLVNKLLSAQKKQQEKGMNSTESAKNDQEKGRKPTSNAQPKQQTHSTPDPAKSPPMSPNTEDAGKDESNQSPDKPSKKTSEEGSNQADDRTGSEPKTAGNREETQGAGEQQANKPGDPADKNQSASEKETKDAIQSEAELATENWLKRIPDQPGLFLKRKFEYQLQHRPDSDLKSAPSEQGDKIW